MQRIDRMFRLAMGIGWFLVAMGLVDAKADTDPKIKDPKLRQELLDRVKTDQAARFALIEFMQKHDTGERLELDKLTAEQKKEFDTLSQTLRKEDQENTRRLIEIVDQIGWPTHSLVGVDGAHAAWLLVQHADANPKFQRRCLDLMAKLPKHEFSQKDYAYLMDRVQLAEGKKQIYGTQFTKENGKWLPRNLEDPEKVDERRKSVGLEPLAEYAKRLEELYDKKK